MGLNSAVITPAAKPPTAAPPTPKPRQSLLTVLTSAVKMKATATARKKSAAKAAVSHLPAGQALKSASLSMKSKKCCCCLRSLWPGRLPCLAAWVMQPAATAPLFLCVMYRVHRAHLSALGPALVALAARPRPKKPQPPMEGVFSFQYNSQCNSQCNSQTGQKVPSPNFVRLGVG
jgi:hypothetical protein